MIKKAVYIFLAAASAALLLGAYAIARSPGTGTGTFESEAADVSASPFEELSRGTVLEVLEKEIIRGSHLSRITESLKVRLLGGSEKGSEVVVEYDDALADERQQEIKTGDTIVVGKISGFGDAAGADYVLADRYRLPYLAWAGAAFLVLALIFGRLRGLTSIVGLLVSIGILVWFVTPAILAGKNPVLVTLVGAGLIAIVSMFLAHGLNRRTVLSVVSTLLVLLMAEGLGYAFVIGAKLLGNGSEEAFYLQAGYFGSINLQGLLLGGIIIGALGILNDITTAQSATVEEIYMADPNVSAGALYSKGSSVGREHIASLINTLVLTYAGASLPLFLLFFANSKQLWTVINSSTIAEEVARTLVGSIALIVAVPLSTALAAYYYKGLSTSASAPKAKRAEDDYWDTARRKVG